MSSSEEPATERQHVVRSASAILGREFEGVFSPETIEAFLAASYDQFAAGARVTSFVPLMAERFTRQRLRALAKVEHEAGDGLPVVPGPGPAGVAGRGGQLTQR